MENKENKTYEIENCLAELGLSSEDIALVSRHLASGEKKAAADILYNYRTSLLKKLHNAQDDLYCIDYLIKEILK